MLNTNDKINEIARLENSIDMIVDFIKRWQNFAGCCKVNLNYTFLQPVTPAILSPVFQDNTPETSLPAKFDIGVNSI